MHVRHLRPPRRCPRWPRIQNLPQKAYQAGRAGKLYFFAFSKNPQVTIGKDIHRYTAEDEKAFVDAQRDDVLFPGLTFGDLYQKRRAAVLVPLQEYVLEKCFYKRAVLIGDSFHKVCSPS